MFDYLPLILGPAIVLVIYLLTRKITSDDNSSILASFLTAVSFQTLVGIYAGFYANWLALIIGYLSFFFLIKFLKESGMLNLAVFYALMIILLFTHVYTGRILAIVMGVFLAVMFKRNYYQKENSFSFDSYLVFRRSRSS
jgi:asparagine N-glycosylation enzyme membrane subunit Stt3